MFPPGSVQTDWIRICFLSLWMSGIVRAGRTLSADVQTLVCYSSVLGKPVVFVGRWFLLLPLSRMYLSGLFLWRSFPADFLISATFVYFLPEWSQNVPVHISRRRLAGRSVLHFWGTLHRRQLICGSPKADIHIWQETSRWLPNWCRSWIRKCPMWTRMS